MCDSLYCIKCGRKDLSTGNHNAVIEDESRRKNKGAFMVAVFPQQSEGPNHENDESI